MAFNRDNRSRGGRDFGRERQMFKATCSNCGKECEVPFKPTGSKPVYCRDCFRTMRPSDSRSNYDRSSRKPNFENSNRNSAYPQYKEQFEAINIKLDKILKLLNPENPIEKPKAISEFQVKPALTKVENVKSVKKKTKPKKQVTTETV